MKRDLYKRLHMIAIRVNTSDSPELNLFLTKQLKAITCPYGQYLSFNKLKKISISVAKPNRIKTPDVGYEIYNASNMDRFVTVSLYCNRLESIARCDELTRKKTILDFTHRLLTENSSLIGLDRDELMHAYTMIINQNYEAKIIIFELPETKKHNKVIFYMIIHSDGAHVYSETYSHNSVIIHHVIDLTVYGYWLRDFIRAVKWVSDKILIKTCVAAVDMIFDPYTGMLEINNPTNSTELPYLVQLKTD